MFYFIKGNRLRVYNENSITETLLNEKQALDLITATLNFDLSGLKYKEILL
jgi:hypothetical protein